MATKKTRFTALDGVAITPEKLPWDRTEKNIKRVPLTDVNGNTFNAIIFDQGSCENENVVYVSENMSGKMTDILSISTTCKKNPGCIAKHNAGNPDSICTYCFANDTLETYADSLGAHLDYQYDLLTQVEIPGKYLPKFRLNNRSSNGIRIESFGDLANVIQAINYFHIIAKNPEIVFGWWTKCPALLWQACIACNGKPKNVNLVLSSEIIGTTAEKVFQVYNKLCRARFGYDLFDFIFTVVRENDHSEKVNCGFRHCADCPRCYEKHEPGSIDYHTVEALK